MNHLSLVLALVAPVLSPGLAPQDSRPAQPDDEGLTQAELEAMTKDILADIEELRGVKYTREVKVSIADAEGFLEYATDRVDRMTTADKVRAESLVLKLYGLIDPDLDYMAAQLEMLEGQVGGFYDPATESFCLMSSFQGGLAKIILAHELTHALDDQLYDIDGTLEGMDGNADAQLAYHAVVEGSGTGLMNRWMISNIGKQVSMKDLAGASEMDTSGLEDAPECMWKPMMMVYLRGASFLVRSDNVMVGQMGNIKNEDLDRAFTDPPRSTEQVLHPEKYWDPKQLDEPRVLTIDSSALVADGWKLLHEDTLGESSIALATSPRSERGGLDATNPMALMGMRYTNRAATGWGGDRYVLLERGGSLLYLMASVWDSDRDALELRSNLEEQAEYLSERRAALADYLAGPDATASVEVHLDAEGDRFSHAFLINGTEDDRLADLFTKLAVNEVVEAPATDR
ncbi:MAG: hypothetical protein P1V81_16330 [Planctomycetota bacterium]|nr:hypothetical protein [Planctomycetota bacterium]